MTRARKLQTKFGNTFKNRGNKKVLVRRIWAFYRRWSYLVISVFLLTLTGIVAAVEVYFSPLSVRAIESDGVEIPDEVKARLYGRKILFITEENINRVLLQENVGIRHITLDKRYPSTLALSGQPREEIFRIQGAEGIFVIDNEGVIFARGEESDLPFLPVSLDNVEIGFRLDIEDLEIYSDVVYGIERLGYRVKEIRRKGGEIEVEVEDLFVVMINTHGYQKDLELLKRIFARLEIEAENIKSVSFVDNKAVVEYY